MLINNGWQDVQKNYRSSSQLDRRLVMATPVLADLRRCFPDAEITAMCVSPISDLLREDRRSMNFLFFPPSQRFYSRRDLRDIIGKLKTGKYDLGILLTNSFSSAWWFWQGRIGRRLGYSGNWRSLLLTDRMEPPENKLHQVEYYKHLLQPLGIPISETAPKTLFHRKRNCRFQRAPLSARLHRKSAADRHQSGSQVRNSQVLAARALQGAGAALFARSCGVCCLFWRCCIDQTGQGDLHGIA